MNILNGKVYGVFWQIFLLKSLDWKATILCDIKYIYSIIVY